MISDNRSTIFCVTSPLSVGCTFLDWSIYWLSGQDQFFSLRHQSWIPLIQDPVATTDSMVNAHGHLKNHPSGLIDTQQSVHALAVQVNKSHLASIYPIPLHVDVVCKKLNFDVSQIENPKVWSAIKDHIEKDYLLMLEWLAIDRKISVIYVGIDPTLKGYFWQRRSKERWMTRPGQPNCMSALDQEWQEVFYGSSRKTWQGMGLTDPWDERERMALDMRPFNPIPYADFSLPFPHTWVNCQDLWFDTEWTVLGIMQSLTLPVRHERLDHWRAVARKWQTVHNASLRFYRMLPQIVNATVKGHYLPLPNLSLQQEAIILHCLIYAHNLNLKSWQLDQFPDNTLHLHKMLEPNIHPIEPIGLNLLG